MRKPIRVALSSVGVACVGCGAYLLWTIPAFYLHSHEVGNQLLGVANEVVLSSKPSPAVAEKENTVMDGVVGELKIDKLSLTAPVVEGTDDPQINVAIGHLKTSVLPGIDGTTVLAAHNATWFRHIDELHAGDVIQVATASGSYQFKVREAKVVHTGDPIYNSTNPSLVLETCYPVNALYLTPYRYLVFADMVSKTTEGDTRVPKSIQNIAYNTNIPDRLQKEGLTLSTNSLPMGTLMYSGSPDDNYVQSNAPLNAASAMVHLYLGWLHASAEKDSADIQALLPEEMAPNPLLGVKLSSIRYQAGFNVQLDVAATTLNSITATTSAVANGHTYDITVHAQANGNDIRLDSIRVTRRT